eukprot:1149900-Pelagomonas_calceolata.AAC.9
MDVWFDSGSSWAGVLRSNPNLNFPADLYLEGSDQHRGEVLSWHKVLRDCCLGCSVAYRGQLQHVSSECTAC